MPDLLPTHKCFDDSLELLEKLAKEDPSICHTNEFLLVHSICISPDGTEYAHAWVEWTKRKLVMFAGIMNNEFSYYMAPIEDYYKEFKVKETTKYTIREAVVENLKHENYGPWIDKYTKLCGNDRKVWVPKNEIEKGERNGNLG